MTYIKKRRGDLVTGAELWEKPGTSQQIMLVGAVHVAHPDYWENIRSLFQRLESEGYEFHLERIQPLENKDGLSTAQLDALGELMTASEMRKIMTSLMQLTGQSEALNAIYDTHGSKDFTLRQMLDYVPQNWVGDGKSLKVLESMKNDTDPVSKRLTGKIVLFALRNVNLLSKVLPMFTKDDGLKMFPKGVVLDKRNEYAIETALTSNADKRVLYWGAAHLPGMAKLLRTHGFRPVSSREWIVAIPRTHTVK